MATTTKSFLLIVPLPMSLWGSLTFKLPEMDVFSLGFCFFFSLLVFVAWISGGQLDL